MALDAVAIAALTNELQCLCGGRIDKIHQPSKDEVVFHLRRRDGNLKLLLSARSGSALVSTQRLCTSVSYTGKF